MRRIAAVLVLLTTATAAQAGIGDGDAFELLFSGIACCASVPFCIMLVLVIAFAVYDWRKARRPPPPPEDV